MSTGIDEKIELVDRIMNGVISRDETEKELDRIASTYGSDVFNEYKVTRKSKPWTKDDLDQLERLSAKGAGSREFYMYMAEMSEELYRKSKETKGMLGLLSLLLKAIKNAFSFIKDYCKKHPMISTALIIIILSVITWSIFFR